LLLCGKEPRPDCSRAPLNLIIQSQAIAASPHQSAELFVNAADRIELVSPGQVAAAIVSQLPDVDPRLPDGVSGWSLSARVTGDIVVPSLTTAGTAGAPVPDGLRNRGFERSEIVNPTLVDRNTGQPQGPGFVSAVLPSFILPITLDPRGTATVLLIDVEPGGPVEPGQTREGVIEWFDNMRGSGQPVRNVATVSGKTRQFCEGRGAEIVFRGIVDHVTSIRGDPNGDAKQNLADAVWIVNELYRGGPATSCQDSADANDDGMMDLADAMFILRHQFQGGPPPAPPFPGCGADPTPDSLDCSLGACLPP
jgi:hypothetical protein